MSWSDLTYMTGEYLSLNVIGNVKTRTITAGGRSDIILRCHAET